MVGFVSIILHDSSLWCILLPIESPKLDSHQKLIGIFLFHFNPLSIWGLKGWKYNNKLTHVCYSHKGDNEIGYLFQWQVTFELGTSKMSLGFTTCFILLK
jgi:hypothetical protein